MKKFLIYNIIALVTAAFAGTARAEEKTIVYSFTTNHTDRISVVDNEGHAHNFDLYVGVVYPKTVDITLGDMKISITSGSSQIAFSSPYTSEATVGLVNYDYSFTFSSDKYYVTGYKFISSSRNLTVTGNNFARDLNYVWSCYNNGTLNQIELTLTDEKPAMLQTVSYIDADGTAKTVEAADITQLNYYDKLSGGWYFVGEGASHLVNKRFTVDDTVNLILCDGRTFTADKGITVSQGNRLNIFGQAEGTGILNANGQNENPDSENNNFFTGIGGYEYASSSGWRIARAGTIAIYGGKVNAIGNREAAGIGSGGRGNGHNVIIAGGYVFAKGGSLAAGIGNGREDKDNNGTITISGGTVMADAGARANSWGGAGIGGGYKSHGGVINITGGYVKATGAGDAPDIGPGYEADKATVTLGWTNKTDGIFTTSIGGTVTLTSDFMHPGSSDVVTTATLNGKELLPKLTISFDGCGARGEMQPVNIAAGSAYTLPDCEFTIPYGKYFNGWVFDEAIHNAGDEVVINNNITMTAVWAQTKCDVLFDLNGHGDTQPDKQTVNYGEHATAPADPNQSGWTFAGWFKEQACTNRYEFAAETVTAPITLYAKWEQNVHTITYVMNGGVNNALNPLVFNADGELNIVAPSREGYTFNGWTFEGQTDPLANPSFANAPDKDLVFTAHWTINQYTVSFDSDGGTPASYAPITANYGTSLAKPSPDPAKAGYLFDGWMLADDGSDFPSTIPGRNVTANPVWYPLNHIERVEPTCMNEGFMECYFGKSFYWTENPDGLTYTKTDRADLVIPALGHQWDEPQWTWGFDSYSGKRIATLRLDCKRCGYPMITTTDQFNHEIIQEPTETTDGEIKYTATIDVLGIPYSDSYTEVLFRTGVTARINETGYPTLKAAIEAAKADDVIVLLCDVNEPDLSVGDYPYLRNEFTLDLNGYNLVMDAITMENSLTVTNGSMTCRIANMNADNNEALILDNASLVCKAYYDAENNAWYNRFEWAAKTIAVTNGSTLDITGPTFLAGNSGLNLNVDRTSRIVLTDVKLTGYNEEEVHKGFLRYLPAGYGINSDGKITYNNVVYTDPVTLRIYDYDLSDDADNDAAINGIGGRLANVTLKGRKLYKDNAWNTLCLPFGLTAAEISAGPLAGCTLMKLDGDASGLDSEGTLTLSFVEATEIESSVPYIIKWDKDDEHPTIDDPLFEEVLISKVLPNEVNFNGGKFIGQFSTFDITAENRTKIVLLGAENKIGYSAEPRSLHAFRAHFEIPDGEQNIKAYKLNFGDGSTTFIAAPDVSAKDNHDWFDLSGRRLSGKPARTGVYIHNGQKVIVR